MHMWSDAMAAFVREKVKNGESITIAQDHISRWGMLPQIKTIKSIMQITPFHFDLKIDCSERTILYQELREISQGGPFVGEITIDGKLIGEGRRIKFGGPALCFNDYIIIPYYDRFRFKLSAINVQTGGIKFCEVAERLILIKGITGDKIEYFNDLDNTQLYSYPLNKLLMVDDVSFAKKKPFWKFW